MEHYSELIAKRQGDADQIVSEVWKTVEENKKKRIAYIDTLVGTYEDPWFGQVEISQSKGKLRFVSKRSSQLQGDMFYYKGDTFAVKWDNAYLHADAFAIIETKEGKVVGMKMLPISPLTDFSYDFQDLDFKKVD